MMSSPNIDPSVLILAGMHRSGTSYVASLLQQAGIDMGEHLLGANDSNPKGHFEDLDFLNFHGNVLQSQGLSSEGWVLQKNILVPEAYLKEAETLLKKRSLKSFWGWKDPRTTLFLDFWSGVLPKAQFLFIYRLPWEVIDSIYRRGDPTFQKNPIFALQVWMNYNEIVLDFCDRYPDRCTLCSVYDISQQPNYLIEILNKRLQSSLGNVENLFDKDNFHLADFQSQRAILCKYYFPEVIELYHQLESRSLRLDNSQQHLNLSASYQQGNSYTPWVFQDWYDLRCIERGLRTTQNQLSSTQSQLSASQNQLSSTQSQLSASEEELKEVRHLLQKVQTQVQSSYAAKLKQIQRLWQQTQSNLYQALAKTEKIQTDLSKSQSQLDQSQRELRHTYWLWQQTQAELNQSDIELRETQAKLQQAYLKLEQKPTTLSEVEVQLLSSQTELEELRGQWQQTQTELHHSRSQLQKVLASAYQVVEAMESSKFWKLRTIWFLGKRLFGSQASLSGKEDLLELIKLVPLGNEEEEPQEQEIIPTGDLEGSLDCPRHQESNQNGKLLVSGWVLSKQKKIKSVMLSVGELPEEEILYGLPRTDVAMVYPDITEAGYSGFSWSLALAPKYTGWMTIKIWVYPENEEKICSFARKVEVINGEISDRPRWENLASYERWRANNTLTPKLMTKMRQDAERLRREKGVKISVVVPVYNTPSHLLKEMLDSVTSQIYPDWELCIADDASSVPHVKAMLEQAAQADARIKVVYRPENGHIVKATNSALEMAEGEYIALLDHDDLLSADALLQVAECVAKFPTVDWIYTDEDKIDESGHHYDPQMKGEWSPEMALTHNYTHHLTVIRRSLVTAIGGLRTDFKGAQDLDLFLRVSEHTTSDRIKHIAQVCYHWRSHPESTASDGKQKEYIFQSAYRAIEEAIARRGLRAKPFLPRIAQQYGLCLHQLRWDSSLIAENPVTIIIPTKDRIDLLKRCLASLLKTLDPQFVKLIIIDDRSVEPETETYLQKLQEDRIFDCLVLSSDQPEDEGFNYAYLMNRALDYIETDYILHLNNDVEAISPGWLEDMVGWMSIAGVGVVGAKLLYPNQTIQHAGVVIGPHDGLADHLFLGLPQKEVGYLCLPHGARNVAAVTGACLLTSTHLYRELGGFDQENFAVQYNDVDYCLRVLQAGQRVVYTPQACLIHQTSASRKDNYNHEEHLNFLKLYGNFQDPFWNESLDINSMFMGINPHRFIHGNRVKSPSIVIITHNLNYEGAPLMIYELAKYLKVQKQCSISFLSLQDGPLKARLEDLKIPVIITSELVNIYEQEVVALEPILKRLGKEVNIKQFDLVIGNTLQSFWGIYLAQIFSLPSLWYIHESTSLELFSQAFKPCIQSIIRNCFVTAARTVFVADATRQLFHQLDREDRFRVIYGGINLQEIEEFRQNHNRDELRAKYGLLDDQIVISILGTTCERKGQHIFVQALKQLASLDPEIFAKVRGLVVGGRKGKYLDFLNDKITSLSLENQVQIYMETKNIYEFFSITDIFVCASSEESFPRVILEAMAFELKIVSTDVFGIKEMIIDNQEGYLIKPNNPQELAEAIRFCMTNPEHSALLARNGAIKVNRCFGNKQLLEKNFALIQETVLLSGGTEGMY